MEYLYESAATLDGGPGILICGEILFCYADGTMICGRRNDLDVICRAAARCACVSL